MMFPRYCVLHRKGTKAKAFQDFAAAAGDAERWGCPILFGTVMVLGPRVGGTVSLAMAIGFLAPLAETLTRD